MKWLCLLLWAGCDDSPPVSMDLSAQSVCKSPAGRVCGYDSLGGCPAEDACNWCDCSNPGGAFGCTLVGCVFDAGAGQRCQSKSECPAAQLCVFDPGCSGEPGRCTAAVECARGSADSWCGCDGTTFNSTGPCADKPHSARGGC